ncbi:MAG: DUF2029 domain-containing protein [Calditrichaeota bacterium]|nr:DUF2029 domain-containing protein [Calditrichota bacterium]
MKRPVLTHLKTQHILKNNHLKSTKLVTTPFQLRLLQIAIGGMAIISVIWLGYEFWRLLFQVGDMGAIDLRNRHNELQTWIEGKNVYREHGTAMYPPASYVLLYPLMGWLSFGAARWFWALTTIVALVILVRQSLSFIVLNQKHKTWQFFVAITFLSMYSIGATIGNGQLPIHIISILLISIYILQNASNLRTDVLSGILLSFAFVKPTLSAPFIWIFFFKNTRVRPFILLGVIYSACILFSAYQMQTNPINLHQDWLKRSIEGAAFGNDQISENLTSGEKDLLADKSYVITYLNDWMEALGLHGLSLENAILGFFILGVWVYFYRNVDIWLLLGVSAIFARFWTYHMWYDDLLLLFPLIGLFRKISNQAKQAITPSILLFLLILFSIAPGGLYFFNPPINTIYVLLQKILWLSILIYFIVESHVQRRDVNYPKNSEVRHKSDAIIVRQQPKLRTRAF